MRRWTLGGESLANTQPLLARSRNQLMTSRKRVKASIIAFCIVVVFINAAYVVWFDAITSGFFYQRLSRLVLASDQAHIDWVNVGSKSFPLAPFLLLAISKITGMSLEAVAHLPLATIFPLVGYLVFSLQILPRTTAALTAATLTLYNAGTFGHFREYTIGWTFFWVFAALVIIYFTRKNDGEMFLTVLIGYLATKLFSPHAEIWALSFILFLMGFMILRGVVAKGRTLNRMEVGSSGIFLIVLGVVSFQYNPKLYEQFFTRVAGANQLGLIFDYLNNIFSPQSSHRMAYQVANTSPPLARKLTIIFLVLVLVACFASFGILVYRWQIDETPFFHHITDTDIIVASAWLAIYPDWILGLTAGRVNLKPITVFGAGLAVYLVWRTVGEVSISRLSRLPIRSDHVLAGVLCLLVVFSQAAFFVGDGLRPVGSESMNEEAALWTTGDHASILTDVHTFSIFALERAEAGQQNSTAQVVYTGERYNSVLGRTNHDVEYGLYVVNKQFDDEPMMRGWRDWAFFEPITKYLGEVRRNSELNRVYTNGGITAYSPTE